MVESSKILTVSYGTFSCTLEGFEDSFSTMKAIAEYFRDLAERDRYFGAEPPTPDAEMLTRIAEREIDRRVEARSDESGIVLRAAEAITPAMPPAAEPPVDDAVAAAREDIREIADDVDHPTAVGAGEEDSADEDMAPDVAATFEDMSPDTLEHAVPHPDPSSVAAKLQRIRAVVGGNDTTAFFDAPNEDAAEPAAFSFDADAAEPLVEETAEASETDPSDEAIELTDEESAIEQSIDAGADDDVDPTDTDGTLADREIDEPFAAEVADVEPADVDVAESEVEDTAEFEAEEEAPETTAEAVSDVAAIAEEDPADVVEEDEEASSFFADKEDEVATSDEAEEAATTRFDDIDSALIASIAENAQPEDTAETEADVEDVQEKPSIRARILRLGRPKPAEAEASDDDGQSNGIKLEDVVAAIDSVAEETNSDASDLDGADDIHVDQVALGEDLSPEDEAELQSDLAAIENDIAAELDETVALNTANEIAEEQIGDADVEMSEEIDETEVLVLENAVIEDNDQDNEDADAVAEEARNADISAAVSDTLRKAEPGTTRLPENDDEAMSRIMEQADEQMDEPEGSRRRQAIAQLKAAVVATEAARQLGDEAKTTEEEQQEYRKDFDEVVRPRRADKLPRAEVRTERPRPGPLKLVASQRIDETETRTIDSLAVAPRRIASSEQDDASTAENFATYAEEVGATELSAQ